jgi:segregation and condensation protein B
MELERQVGLIEAILLLENEPVELAGLQRISGLERQEVLRALDFLREEYRKEFHGLELAEIGGGFSLAPKQPLWVDLRERYGRRNENRLSRAAMETLSIIAYSQPITRQEIESIRGVSADGMIKLLAERQLIKEVGKKEAPGRPVQYGTTKEFLKLFRLASIADLPKMDELDQERFEPEGGGP